MAAMLEVVRQLTNGNSQGVKRKNTILFIAFDANELGKQYARYLVKFKTLISILTLKISKYIIWKECTHLC